METEEEAQGSFKLLRSFLGSIAGGLSSLASLPFGKRKKPESPLLADPAPSSSTGVDLNMDDLSRLYPDIELSETRKRARLSLENVLENTVGFSNLDGKFLDTKDLDEKFERGSGDTSLRFDRALFPLGDEQYAADNMLDNAAMNADRRAHGEIGVQFIPDVSAAVNVGGHDEALLNEGEDLRKAKEQKWLDHTAAKVRKAKEKKLLDSTPTKDRARKTVRFSESKLGNSQPNGSMPKQKEDMRLNKRSTRAKRKRVDVAENTGEKNSRPFNLSGKPVRPEGRTSTVGMSNVLTRKRRRENNQDLVTEAATEDLKPQKDNWPKMEGETNKRSHSRGACSGSNDEKCAKAAVAHEIEELTNSLHSSGAHAGVTKELTSAPVDETWRVFVSNTPADVKDEELIDLFSVCGSLELEVATVRVVRDPYTGLSKGTAYVFFKTEADVNQLLSSRRCFKLRGRVLRISRAVASAKKSERLQSAKRPTNPQTKDSNSPQKQVSLSSINADETAANELVQEVGKILTRSRKSIGDSGKGQSDVMVASSPVMATQQKSQQARLAKGPNSSETKDSKSPKKQVKLSSFCGGETAETRRAQDVVKIVTRSRRSSAGSDKEQLGVVVTSSHVYATRSTATGLITPPENVDESCEPKRAELEKNQIGISRSKNLRRT